MSDTEPGLDHTDEPSYEGSARPPTKVPGVWAQIPTPVKIVMGLLLLAAAGGVFVATRLTNESTAQFGNGIIEQQIPRANDQIVQQAPVGIDLATGYTADLTVNGIPIPEDELTRIPAFNQVQFQPGEGKTFEAWPAGQNCVLANYWKYENPGERSQSTWCFSVV